MKRFVRKEIVIGAPRETVWSYLEDPALLAAWLMRNDYRPELDRPFCFYSQPRGSWDRVVHCRVTELDPPSRLSFTWNANDLGADTLVTIELLEEGEQTRVRLHHTNFDGVVGDVDEAMKRHDAGWADHLSVLAGQAAEEAADDRDAPPIDWTEFSLHVAIDAAPEAIVDRWRTSTGMESFFVEMMRIAQPEGRERGPDEAAKPGDRYTWRWHSGRRLSGEFLAPELPHEVQFTFGESKVSVRCLPYRGGGMLVLRQYDIPDTEQARMHVHANCRAAWVYFLTVLKTLLENGVDGRDLTRETGASFSTYFDLGEVMRAEDLSRG